MLYLTVEDSDEIAVLGFQSKLMSQLLGHSVYFTRVLA